jgi:diguanylate cyclase (GGDEF)-like protein
VKKLIGSAGAVPAGGHELVVSTVTAANEPRHVPSRLSTRAVLDASATVTLLINVSGVIEFESAEFARVTGWPPGSCVGKPCFEVLRVNAAQRILSAFGLIVRGRLKRATFEFEVTAANGNVLVFLATLSDALAVAEVGAIIVTGNEMSRRKAFEIALRHNANHDSLTGLFNRRAALRQINRWISGSESTTARPAVLLLDIDGFKGVNDVYGHAVGDAMLVALAERLRNLDPDNVGVARLGGDELLLFARYEDLERQLPQIAVAVLAAMRKPVLAESHWIHSSASIGIAAYPEGGVSADELVRHADVALYQAKDAGRNTVRWFNREVAAKLRERTVLRRELEIALSGGEFAMHFQPILDVTSRSVHSHEALLRWQHAERGLLTAGQFIHEVDGAGLTVPLAQWVLREAFASAQRTEAMRNLPVAINVHPRLFQRADFARNLLQVLRNDNIDPSRLALEITEQDFVRTADASPTNILALADAGVRIIIDDFGKGFSNFGYLIRMPVHSIKIDREFVAQIGLNERSETLIGAIVRLAGDLGIQSIGEGIESAEQSEFLVHQGCMLQQGFFWGRPSPEGASTPFAPHDAV